MRAHASATLLAGTDLSGPGWLFVLLKLCVACRKTNWRRGGDRTLTAGTLGNGTLEVN
jgi:hypothetical protein